MVNFFIRYWKTLAITSISIVSSYFFSHYDYSRINNHLLSALTVQAAEFLRKAFSKNSQIERRKNIDDDDDVDDEENEKDDLNTTDKSINNVRERRFCDFASIEYNGEIYMIPTDFLESVLAERSRPRIGRRQLIEDMVNTILYMTLPKHRGSKRFFRNLEDAGLISYAEYLFLWVILTKPSTQFELTYAVFDTDGNQLVDKDEFLLFDNSEQTNTTLLIHFFGKIGRHTLNYAEFKREFSHGFKTMSELSFAEMLLRYADFDHHTKKSILKNVRKLGDKQNAITFEEFKHFSVFLNNLEDFTIGMRFHQLSNKPISQAEFQRAVKISMGSELESHIIALIFRIFDANEDQHLSYNEFMTVMKDRLSRNFHTHNDSEVSNSKFDQFKRCVREQAKYDSIIF
ncbi:unnamed protein product [Rotaria sp. Silwood1]|nr:unnamed protein product [Rotaria sp. Silwood1]